MDLSKASNQELLDELARRADRNEISIAIKVAEMFGVSKQYISQVTSQDCARPMKNTRIYNTVFIVTEDARQFLKVA